MANEFTDQEELNDFTAWYDDLDSEKQERIEELADTLSALPDFCKKWKVTELWSAIRDYLGTQKMDTKNPIDILEEGLKEVELHHKIYIKHGGNFIEENELYRNAKDYISTALELLRPKEKDVNCYQVWVTLEKWQDENKICDIETCLVGTIKTEEEGRQLFIAAQDVSLAIKSSLEPMLKTLEI